MQLEYDQEKRQRTLDERGLDFEGVGEVLQGLCFTRVDDRKDYGEQRFISVGRLQDKIVVVVWTRRGEAVRSYRCVRHDRTRGIFMSDWVDPDDAPPLPKEWFEGADLYSAGKLVRRGRPKLDAPKRQVSIRLDADLLDRLKASGPGWQGRLNDIVRKAMA